jgi:hypothetical protein
MNVSFNNLRNADLVVDTIYEGGTEGRGKAKFFKCFVGMLEFYKTSMSPLTEGGFVQYNRSRARFAGLRKACRTPCKIWPDAYIVY